MPKCCVTKCLNRSEKKEDGVTFHRFPYSRPDVVEKWIRNIGRKDFRPSKISVVCSKHFEDHCFNYDRNSFNVKNKILKRDAVPTLFYYPLQLQNGIPLIKHKKSYLSSTQRLCDKYDPSGTSKNESSLDSRTQENILSNNPFLMVNTSLNIKEEIVDIEPSLDPVRNISVSATVTMSENSPVSLKITGVYSLDDVQKLSSVNFVPDSLDSQSVDLKSELENFKVKVKQYKKTLKVKQQNIRRLNKRIRSLEEKVKGLEGDADLAKHSEELVKQYFSGAALDIFLGILKRKSKTYYPSSLRLFALNFFRISPKAYNFVYSTFKGGFPNPKAVRRWNLDERKKQSAEIDEAILQTITGSQSEEIDDDYIGIQSEEENSPQYISQTCTLSEESNLRLNQCSEMELDDQNVDNVSSQPGTFAEDNFNTQTGKKFSSDIDELIKITLSGSYSEKNNKTESKGYYVVRLENPNSKKNESDVELSNHENCDTYSSEEQNTDIINGEYILPDENCAVVVATE